MSYCRNYLSRRNATENEASTSAAPSVSDSTLLISVIMSDEELKRFVDNVRGVRFGNTINEALAILGSPNEGPYSTSKRAPDAKMKTFMTYYVYVPSVEDFNEAHDKYVTFYFNNDDRLFSIRSTVGEVESREVPEVKK